MGRRALVGWLQLLLLVPGVALAKWDPPPNVTVRREGRAEFIESADFSYVPPKPIGFPQLKMCIAEKVTNGAVTLQDSSGSFVGSSGSYYQSGNTQTVQGGGIFKYVDDASGTLIAAGSTEARTIGLQITHDIVKFELKAVIADGGVALKFINITRAQQSSGSLPNGGFQPVGTWWGAGAEHIYNSLERVASSVKGCLQ